MTIYWTRLYSITFFVDIKNCLNKKTKHNVRVSLMYHNLGRMSGDNSSNLIYKNYQGRITLKPLHL